MKLAVFAAAGLVLAPIAHAQDCGPLHRVIASAVEEGFESISGDLVADGYFETNVSFFDADECSVDSIGGQYFCLWDRPSVDDADTAIAPLYDMAKVCLSGGWEWTDLAGEKRPNTIAITEGYRMTSTRGAHKGAVVQVYMDGMATQPWRQVWLEVWWE
ncbi:MAG: hypothetical protein B7Y90_18350 [Alphaproteobacteria bacterium 32-64-14]|nr:MAG: hypothetical protein B7Y90_18350 [Alphaproteobacteria bacterium 32-64-14]